MEGLKRWCIIQLADENETPLLTEDDLQDGFVYYGFETKKKAEEQAKIWRWCDKWSIDEEPKKYRYIVVREEEI